MTKKALIVILFVFCWLIIGEMGTAEVVLKGECSVQIKNYSGEMIDI